jgi:hypothetical protein
MFLNKLLKTFRPVKYSTGIKFKQDLDLPEDLDVMISRIWIRTKVIQICNAGYGWTRQETIKTIRTEQCCGSGSEMNFFRIPDPGSGPFFDDIFLQYLQNPCYVIFITLAYS